MTTMHWHGMHQVGTSFFDGPPGYNQCLINSINASGKLLMNTNNVTKLSYLFKPHAAGTFWYHGHYKGQTSDGIFGPIIVEDSPSITQAYAKYGMTYTAETTLIIGDFYNQESRNYIPYFLSPASKGFEPIPDAIFVNNQLPNSLVVNINKKDKLRVRLINAGPMSMFKVYVDGMALNVIEIDGVQTVPFNVSYVPVNVAQRASFILDWSQLPLSMQNSPSVLIRVINYAGGTDMYRRKLQNTKPMPVRWTGRFMFNDLKAVNNGNPNYNIITPITPGNTPRDPNLLEASLLFPTPVPSPDLKMNYLIQFQSDSKGVDRAFINGETFPGPTTQELNRPVLYEYMSASGGPLTEPQSLPVGATIPGDGLNPFVLPYGRTVDIFINNTDIAQHPVHLHGHTFWIIRTSSYDSGRPILRDIVSIPSNGWAIIRMVANNPGVWLLHCHIDWHFMAGFAATIIEAPSKLKGTINNIPADHKAACPSFFNS